MKVLLIGKLLKTRKYPLCGYIPSLSRVPNEDNIKERKLKSKAIFWAGGMMVTDNGKGNGQTDVVFEIVF